VDRYNLGTDTIIVSIHVQLNAGSVLLHRDDKVIRSILERIANNPKVSAYKIGKVQKPTIPHNVVTRKIRQYRFVENEILKQEEISTGQRISKPFSLTFRGLLYAVKIDAVHPEDGSKIRRKNNISLPLEELSEVSDQIVRSDSETTLMDLITLVETQRSQIFYEWLKEWIDPTTATSMSIRLLSFFAGLLSLGDMFQSIHENGGEVKFPKIELESEDRQFGEIVIARESFELLYSILSLLKPFISSNT